MSILLSIFGFILFSSGAILVFAHENIKEIIIGIVLVIVSIIFFIIGGEMDNKDIAEYNAKLWNDGVCSICGSEMEYSQAIAEGKQGIVRYIYICEDCGHMIKMDEYIEDR